MFNFNIILWRRF